MVGVVILNYRTPLKSIECAKSIIEHTRSDFHIYVVDNNSQDYSYEIMKKEFIDTNNVTVLLAEKNGGYSFGNNLGAKVAINDKCSYVFIVNSDIKFENNALDIMLSSLLNNPGVSVVGPSILSSNRLETQKFIKGLTFKRYMLNKLPLSLVPMLKDKSDRFIQMSDLKDQAKVDGMPYGCCFLIDAQIFECMHGFDEKLFLYHEEDVLAYKLNKIGAKAIFESKAKVVHNHSYSISKEGRAFERFYRYTSALYVLRGYGGLHGLKLLIPIFINVLPYTVKSLSDNSYRKRLIEFYRTIFEIIKIEPYEKLDKFIYEASQQSEQLDKY